MEARVSETEKMPRDVRVKLTGLKTIAEHHSKALDDIVQAIAMSWASTMMMTARSLISSTAA